MCKCASTRTEKEEMLQYSRKDDEQRDAAALGTLMVAEMLQHSGVQNRQKCRKDKAARYFAAHMAFLAGIVPYVKGIFP
ncbi:hypothetical protein V6N11_020205 [Hibiscus sabdariffa]|uniref:Uncharacterized protein n=1 Tax=Hibiscus sabdariffa TaxID=183260 RepID=A0ABR2Q895_9ROSI